jgi:hypothetical protein
VAIKRVPKAMTQINSHPRNLFWVAVMLSPAPGLHAPTPAVAFTSSGLLVPSRRLVVPGGRVPTGWGYSPRLQGPWT